MAETKNQNALNRIALIVLFAAFVLLRLPNFTLVDHRWSDVNLYQMLARQMTAGQTPYVDFNLEYPPLTLIFFYIPGLIARATGNFDIPYRLFMTVFDIGCLLLVGAIVRRLIPDKPGNALSAQLLYLAMTAISFQVLYDRFDIAVAFLILLAVYLAIAGKWVGAYIAVILGAFAKLFPVLLLPLLVIHQVRRARAADAVRNCGIALLAGLVLLIASVAFFGDWWGYLLEYHGRRGIQIESLYASVIMLARYLGVKAAIGHEYGAFQISNAFSGFLVKASMLFMAIGVLAVYIVFACKRSDNGSGNLILSVLSVLTVFALFNKVLSPQFFLWLYPMAGVAIMMIQRRAALGTLWALTAVSTATLFPFFYRPLVALEVGAVALLIARNAAFSAAAVLGFLLSLDRRGEVAETVGAAMLRPARPRPRRRK
jgi:Glycosyltransferase family 87